MPADAGALSGLALRSKAHWGYSQEFIAACRAELTYAPERMCEPGTSFVVAEVAGTIVGFYALARLSPAEAELEALFVEPDHIRRGIGRRLMEDALQRARTMAIRRIVIQGDPNAADFYRATGAVQVGTRESASIPGRILPLFAVSIEPS